ncbi:DEAD/DEAH box helicase [Streptomyces flavalbus]|uniref:DEAD/DEAH box helicase n=1 Tax=Streptomyces flavalbus TaxID=2665155 RepID=A0ABW2W5U7_9ACTN
MSLATLDLTSPVFLVPGNSLERQLRDKARVHPALPAHDVQQIAADLGSLRDGVPARIDEGGGGRDASLLLHTASYRLRLFPTNRGTGYVVGAVDPVRLRDHNELARSCLLLRAPAWHMMFNVRAVPLNADAGWQRVLDAWWHLGAVRAAPHEVPAPNPAEAAFLDSVGRLIDASERITTREERLGGPYPYAEVVATGGRRHGPRALYDFRVVGPALPEPDTFVEVRGEVESRGQVTRVDGDLVTVRFDERISWDHLPPQGELTPTPNTVVFAKQREAVRLLRDRGSRNPRLLPALAEHRVGPLRPSTVTPTLPLDDDQLTAFHKALATDDVLVVLGPPGTGKTRTITQIAHACAGGRVLVTSHTNRAVDNVLGKLPRDLVVIRVGNDGKVSDEGRPYLLEHQAAELAQEVTGTMGLREEAYAHLDAARAWAGELAREVGRLDELTAAEATAQAELDAARRTVGAPVRQRLDELTARRDQDRERHQRTTADLEQAALKVRRTRERADGRALGWLHRALLPRRQRRLDELRAREAELRAALTATDGAITAAEREWEAVTRDAPAVRRARDARQRVLDDLADTARRAHEAADRAASAVAHVDTPPWPRPADGHTGPRELHDWLTQRLPLLLARRELTSQWRAAVAAEPGQLTPELIRYAHVVGATCIGAASRPELSGIDFDLAIVDEAGQIGVADALVPLVRARRGVLVGDHMQLPPFLDSEVDSWGRDVACAEVRELMTKSALERLVDGLPESHVVHLTLQRRMPVEIASFASAVFYGNRLRTEHDHPHDDPLFASPMAFVDTGGLPARLRRETATGRATERFARKGVRNDCEARLLARLAAFYHRRGTGWTVIVPYRAQITAVTAALTPLVGAALAADGVKTVDSFQGGEREVVLYGFTRSNAQGRVGFLKELRRANVAFTRAQRQLVLVGDLGTLLSADDPDFRALATELHRHLTGCGDIRSYDDIVALLDKAAPEGDGTA